MKLNKKGTSLMELIISIALVSVVLIFMIKLLIDVNNMETNNVYAKDNQLNRAEIIRTIENDISNKVITNVSDVLNADGNGRVISFEFNDTSKSTLNFTKDTLEYTSSEGTRKWTMNGATLNTGEVIINRVDDNKENIDDNLYFMNIIIEVYTTNDRNKAGSNNSLDDIQISYIGKLNDLDAEIELLDNNS